MPPWPDARARILAKVVGALHASSLDPPRALAEDARRVGDERLWELAGTGDAGARDLLVEHHIALAHKLARRYARSSEPIEDLEQVACLGLVRAVDRFDPSHGTSFTTFAVPTILGEIRRHFRDRTWSVRVPRSLRDAAAAVGHAQEALAKTLGRTPSAKEVADELGMSVERVLAAREAALAYRSESLDRPVRADETGGTATLGDRLGECDEELRRAEDGVLIEQLATETLSHRDREVLRLRFHDDLLQREIAERVGVSQMQVSRILREAVRTLQAVAR